MLLRPIFVILVVLLSHFIINAQGAVYNVTGKITEKGSKLPVNSAITFKNEKGEVNRSKTNSDGTFSVVLQANSNYILEVPNYLTTFDDVTFNLPSISKYTEIVKNFEITKMNEGLLLISANCFDAQKSEVIAEKATFLNDLKELMNIHKNVVWEIKLSTEDSYFADISKKETYLEGKKKKTRKIVTDAKSQAQILMNERVASIENFLQSLSFRPNSFIITQDLKIGPKPPKPTKSKKKVAVTNSNAYNVSVSISKIKILK